MIDLNRGEGRGDEEMGGATALIPQFYSSLECVSSFQGATDQISTKDRSRMPRGASPSSQVLVNLGKFFITNEICRPSEFWSLR
jgi:hypothetical protein